MRSKETLINLANYYVRNDLRVPTDVLARLLDAGVDISNYK